MAPDTYCVFGFCRAAVGGHRVWREGGDAVPISSADGVIDTSINRMNYAALELCLNYILDHAQQSADEVVIRCGCFMVCRQVDHTMRSVDLQTEHSRVMQRLNRLTNLGIIVRVAYDRSLAVPRDIMDPSMAGPGVHPCVSIID